jgi:NAD-dependent SIR2 family protein deacetylase
MENVVIEEAARTIREADALLINAGAGMGVDSGLPDFRGNEGFWNAYPPYRELGVSFVEMANPRGFVSDPEFAWGFYGHRLNLYRETEPHDGFHRLLEIGSAKPGGYFVFTSNVDGQFQKAGFDEDRIAECHGSIHHLQCVTGQSDAIWSAKGIEVRVDTATMRAVPPLPACPGGGGIARPNILMFGDFGWLPFRTDEQMRRYEAWLVANRDRSVAVVECGAGTAVPTVRYESERVARGLSRARLIRINPRDTRTPSADDISIASGAGDAIRSIVAAI